MTSPAACASRTSESPISPAMASVLAQGFNNGRPHIVPADSASHPTAHTNDCSLAPLNTRHAVAADIAARQP